MQPSFPPGLRAPDIASRPQAVLGRMPRLGSPWRPEFALLLLVALSIAAVTLYEPLMRQTQVIEPTSRYSPVLISDRESGGQSEAHRGPGRGFELLCNLSEAYQYRYCGIVLQYDPRRIVGVDLSSAQRMRAWIEVEGPASTFVLTLRNANPAYGLPMTNRDAAKYNQIEPRIDTLRNGMIEVDLSDFFVANWWMQKNGIPTRLSRPEFSNVVALELVSASGAPPGRYRLVLHRLEFDTHRMSREHWYRAILGVWLASALAYLLLRMLQLQRQSRQLMQVARTDVVTGTFNRQGLDELMAQAHAEARATRRPLSMVMVDIDHFKSVNDLHGHQAGDRVLGGLVELMRANVRSQDVVGRWGGEEFVLICRDARLAQAVAIAQKLRALVAAHDFSGLSITASFGVAEAAPEGTLEELFATADAALYRAKEGGRNRVEAGPPGALP